MARLNNLLYSVLAFMLFAVSANAEWKMFNSEYGVFIYETQKGIVLKYDDTRNKQEFILVPLKAEKYHSSGEELLKNITPPKP